MKFFNRPPQDPAPQFVRPDRLARLIQQAIRELEREGAIESEYGGPPPRFNGYCARACQAYYHLARDERTAHLADHPAATVKKHQAKGAQYGDSHYGLETDAGVMDLIFAPRENPDRTYPYGDHRGATFRRNPKNPDQPQRKDTRLVIERVHATAARPT